MKHALVRGTLFILAFILLVGLIGCGSKTAQKTDAKDTTLPTAQASAVPIHIGTLQTDDLLPGWVAQDKGYFKDAGLDVEITVFQSAQEQMAAMTAGKIDAMMTDMVVPVQLAASGTPVRAVTITQSAPAGIVASKKSGITQLSQLAGVKTGCSSPTAMEYIYDRALEDAGIAQNDIKTSEIKKIPVRLQMLQAGQLKAAVLPWTLFSLSESQGAVPLLDQEAAAKYGSTLLVFSQKWLDGADAATHLDSFLKAYDKGVTAVNSMPLNYRVLLAEKAKLPESLAQNYPVRSSYPPVELPRAEVFDDVVKWMVEKGYIDKAIPYTDLVYAAAGA